ncbi:hypothetical protein HDU87_000914 [Geranomyces variabilis]|uniref:SHSP domain-containing protein n=1 Tax=Geranomyces variabilis TaxID=109894 RepID=A0AAD5TBY2_9FUNG|nr:hypothetical protein HDU87_000914 [Geranomyces variabilis]
MERPCQDPAMGVFIRLPAPLHTWHEDVIEAALPNVVGVEHVIKKDTKHFAHIHFTSLYHAAIFFRQWGGQGFMIDGKRIDVKPGQLNGQPVQYADPDTLIAPTPEVPANHPHQLPRQPVWGSGVRSSHQMRVQQTETQYHISIQAPTLVEGSLVIEVEDGQTVIITGELQNVAADGLLFSNEAEGLSVVVPLPSKVLEGDAKYKFDHGILKVVASKNPVEGSRKRMRLTKMCGGVQQKFYGGWRGRDGIAGRHLDTIIHFWALKTCARGA